MLSHLLHLATVIGIYALATVLLSLAMRAGTGLSLAHSGVFALGAYAFALSDRVPFGSSISLFCAAAVGALGGLVLSIQAQRVGRDIFAVTTLFTLVVWREIALNWTPVTGGAVGIPGIQGFENITRLGQFGTVLTLLATVAMIIAYVMKSPLGSVLIAAGRDPTLLAAFGRNANRYRLWTLNLACAGTGLAGGLYAAFIQFVDPSLFSLSLAILFILSALIGGQSVIGVIAATTILVLVPEALRWIQLPYFIGPSIKQIVYGVALIMIVVLRATMPSGTLAYNGRNA